jgi:OOP family OmpA-OmpF porin
MKPTTLSRLSGFTTLGLLGLSLAGTAHAQDAAYSYFGLGVGQSHSQLNQMDTTNSLLGAGNGASLQDNEQQDTAYKIFGGYQFNRNFALEAGYFNLGKFTYRAANGANTLNGTYEVEGLNLDLVGTIPLSERFSAFGRFGLQHALTRDGFSGTGTLAPANNSVSKRENNLKVGVGLQYDISPTMQLRGEAERYRINDALDNRGDINVFSLSLVFPVGRKAAALPTATQAVYVPPPEPVAPEPAPAPLAEVAPPVVVVAPPPPPPAPTRVQLSADSMFGFDKAMLGPDGKGALDRFAKSTEGVKFDAISVEGNADRLGKAAYNDRLALQRAEAVKAYLATTPQLQNATIRASSKGQSNPMTQARECVGKKPTKALIACLQPDRRVDVELTGVR